MDRRSRGDSRLGTAHRSILDDFERAVRAAENAVVAFYTISPREAPSASSSLQRLAGATGGEALFLDDGLSERLSGVADDAAASY